MEKKLILSINDDENVREFDDFLDAFSMGVNDGISINIINKDDNVFKILQDKKKILEIASSQMEIFRDEPAFIEIWNSILENIDNLFDSIEYVDFKLDKIDFMDFLNSNPELKSKKIILPGLYCISDKKKLLEAKEKYKDIDLYVDFNNNSQFISIDDCLKTIDFIESKLNYIKSLELSPIEEIMYVFDFAKQKIYKEVGDGEEKSISRDLSSVLFQDSIVCVGYANIMDSYLNFLNNPNVVSLTCNLENLNDDFGHMRNKIYVKDEKYGIDGVYYFDATWCSKESIDDEEYVNNYSFFAKTFEQAKIIDEKQGHDFFYIEDEFLSEDFMEKLEKLSEKKDFSLIAKEITNYSRVASIIGLNSFELASTVFKVINWDSKFINKLSKNVDKIKEMYDRPLSGEQFLEILKNVRLKQVEAGMDPKYYTVEGFARAYNYSKFRLQDIHYSIEEKMLKAIFGGGRLEKDLKKDFLGYCQELEIPRIKSLLDKNKVKKIETQ